MSRVDSGPLATYNSLMDRHLAGYFCNDRRRKHLVKSGLITKRGEVISENTYRLNMARKEHKKHVKDLLAQAIVHKALDWERTRQVKIKQKLEEISKIELVRRVKSECTRQGDEDVLPYLTPRGTMVDPSHPGASRNQKRSKSAGASRERDAEGIMIDDEGCPICSREGSQASHSRPQSSKRPKEKSAGSKYPKGEIDSRHLYALDQYALYEYNMTRTQNEQSRTSTYLTPLIGKPKNMVHSPQPPAKPKPESKRPKTSTGEKKGYLHPPVAPMSHPEEAHSNAEVTIKYLGAHLKLSYEPIGDPRHDVLVEQQPFGGNTLNVFKKPIMPGDTFSFVSTRHRGYPFSLTFYVNGVQNARLSTCCEYKHKVGAKIGGKAGHFAVMGIEGGIGPCFKCSAAGKGKKKEKKEKEEKEKEEEEEKVLGKDDGIVVPVEDENDDDYDDDFEDDDDNKKDDRSDRERSARSDSRRSDRSSAKSDRSGTPASPTRGSGSDSPRVRSRDSARDSPVVMRMSPTSPDLKPRSDDEQYSDYVVEVEKDDDDDDKTPIASPKQARSPSPPKKTYAEAEARESGKESAKEEESDVDVRPYSRATLTDAETTPRTGVTSESESQEDYPDESSVEAMVKDKRDIEITNIHLKPKQMAELAKIIRDRTDIVSIVLRNCGLDDGSCRAICDAIITSPSEVKLVNLNANKAMTTDSADSIARMVKEKKSIQVLLLHGTALGDKGIRTLIDVLEKIFHDSAPSSPHLREARVMVQGVMDDLAAEDTEPKHQLTHLDIGDTKMTDKSAQDIARLIILNSQINVLSLTGCTGFSSNSWKHIFESLKANANLTKLCLDYCNLRDSTVEVLCECLYSHPKIECLDLEGNGLTDRSVNALVLLAQSNNHIRRVKLLPGNDMTDDALDDIQDALRR